jgi:hypothetical protein
MWYAEYILTNEQLFYELMDKVIMPLYSGENVLVLVHSDDGYAFDNLTESVQKYILGRYGYKSYFITSIEDIHYMSMEDEIGSFTVNGIGNLDIDKERYSLMYARTHKIKGVDYE